MNPVSFLFLCLVVFSKDKPVWYGCLWNSLLSLNMKLFVTVNLQIGEAYLTDMTRELQQKSQLLESSISFMKSLESPDNTMSLPPKPDPVRVCVSIRKLNAHSSCLLCHSDPRMSTTWEYRYVRTHVKIIAVYLL